IRAEIASPFHRGEVGFVRPTLAAEMVVFLEIWGRLQVVAIGQRLDTERDVSAWRPRHRVDGAPFLREREGEESMRRRAQCLEYLERHAVPGNGEEADLAAGLVDERSDRASPVCATGPRPRQIDDRNTMSHGGASMIVG